MNLRKCTSMLLVFLLLASNAGLAFNVHYCAGEIASVKAVFQTGDAPIKSGCGMDEAKSHGCCKDKVIKSDKKQDVVVKTFAFSTDASIVSELVFLRAYNTFSEIHHKTEAAYCCDAHAPPLFKLYSQYTFYA